MMRDIARWLRGERRRTRRYNAEKVQVTNRLADAELQVARMYGQPPEQLFDYYIADRILGRRHDDAH